MINLDNKESFRVGSDFMELHEWWRDDKLITSWLVLDKEI